VDDIERLALAGKVVVCIVEDVEGVRVAGAIEFKHYPQMLALNIMALAGRDFVDIAADMLAPLCAVARTAGASAIEASCSPAMARLLAAYGFADTYRVVRHYVKGVEMDRHQMNAQLSAEFGGPAIGAWPTAAGGRLRPHKGGDGGAAQARQMEDDRQARIKTSVDAINGIFGQSDRNAMYDDQKQAVTDLNRREVDRQYSLAERDNRFGLARNGLLGGSVDVDSNADLQRRTNEGIIQSTAVGDQAAADLRTADERTRQGLISMAQSGIDTGTAQQTALAGLNANSQAAAGARGGATIGSLFGDLSNAYLANQVNAGRAAGGVAGQQQQWFGVSDPRRGANGTVTP
jgi:hypothetical protein